MAAGREVGRRGELQAAAVGSSSRRALLSRDPVLFLAARKRPVGRVWRGADPQARPRSAIDCSAFPINYSLIMENRRHWLHGSGSSSHVAVLVKGQARRACAHLPAPTSLLAAREVASSPRLPPALQSWPAGQAPARRPSRCVGWRWEPRDARGGAGTAPAPVGEGSLFLPGGQLAAC